MLSNMALVEFVAVAAAVCLLVALWARPVGLFAVVFAFAIVGAAILMSWNDIDRVRAQRAASAAVQREIANASPRVTVPPPDRARSGS